MKKRLVIKRLIAFCKNSGIFKTIFLGFLFICVGISAEDGVDKMNIQGESMVLARTEPGNLCFDQVEKGSLTLRSTFVAGERGIAYAEGRDYVVDYAKGSIARTADSRIPDYSTHPCYGKKDFKHEGISTANQKWFVWADYRTANWQPWAKQNDQSQFLAPARRKLEGGGAFKIVSYGDSITAGGEASEMNFRFQQRFVKYLRAKFPKSKIEARDVSIPGYASRQGIDWFDKKPKKLLPPDTMGTVEKPDLVLVGFGMNDHNKGTVEPEMFKNNLITLVKLIRERHGADVILFSAFPPNDNWYYGSHRMNQFAEATKQAAAEAKCAYVDVYSTWEMVLKRKDQSSLLGNNINHPNDFGHWLYEQAFEAMTF